MIPDKELREILVNILGEDAISESNMQVSERVSRLTKCVAYMALQMKFLANEAMDTSQKAQHLVDVLTSVKNILKP